MTYADLAEFLEKKMSMSHIYQPLLVKSLVDSGGTATLRQLAQHFLSEDESQLLYYVRRIKEMPLKVLLRHGVVTRSGDLVSLSVGHLDLQQRAHIKMLCEERLRGFVQKRGLGTWDYRLLDVDPVPDSLRYRVLKEAGGRCALCGVTSRERPIDVDHIIPRNRGGKTEQSNLQALCSKCNRSKRDQDDTDFRKLPEILPDASCPFCDKRVVRAAEAENGSVVAIRDKFPVTPGHLLILPRRHVPDWFSMTSVERGDTEELLRVLQQRILQADKRVKGFNIGMNCGADAGQTVPHAHTHLIPRRAGDVDNPTGGVRGVIPEKRIYAVAGA